MNNPKRHKNLQHLSPNYFDEHGKPRVCELYAGITTMSCFLQSVGFAAALFSEILEHLQQYIAMKHPSALVAGDTKHKPWLAWKEAGILALIIVAGISCQPFSEAGPRRFQNDPRAWDALLVCEAAASLEAIFIMLENVPNFTDKDQEHKVFTKILQHYSDKGYVLVRILRPKHQYCGGHTYRSRVLPIFIKKEYADVLDLSPIHRATYNTPPPDAPLQLQLDRTRNWAHYATLSPDGTTLKFNRGFLVPGAAVSLPKDARLWRVQKLAGDQLHLIDTNRRSSQRITANRSSATAVDCDEAAYQVFRPHQVVTTIRASGDPPGYGAPLILDGRGVWSIALADRATYNDFPQSDLELLLAKATPQQASSAIGNCIPLNMVTTTLSAIVMVLSPLVWGTQQQPTDTAPTPCNTIMLTGGPSAAAALKPTIIAYVEVQPQEKLLVLQDGLQPLWLKPRKPVLTGHVKAEAQKLLGTRSAHKILVPSGIWKGDQQAAHVLAAVTDARHRAGTPYTLKQLRDEPVYPIASLALAKLLAHSSGHTTPEDIAPLLDGSGEFATGALMAKQLHPPKVSQGSCVMTRTQALVHCRAAETQAEDALRTRSALVAQSDPPLSQKLSEWADQVTVTDLKDIPDELLKQIPEFSDPQIMFQPFSHTAVMAATDPFDPPKQPDVDFQPQVREDLWVPTDSVYPPSLPDIEHKLSKFYDLLWEQSNDPRALAKARPDPYCWGLGHTVPQAQGCIWDLTGDRPKPVDLNSTPSTHIRLDKWLARFKTCVDQQLVCHLTHGVCSMADLDFTSVLAPPLLPMAEGIHSIALELDRLVELGYLKVYDSCPCWPIYAGPNGAVAKKGSDVWRRISDYGFPQRNMVTSEFATVIPPNVWTRWNLKLPKEIKPMYGDLAVDMCVLRYLGDFLDFLVSG